MLNSFSGEDAKPAACQVSGYVIRKCLQGLRRGSGWLQVWHQHGSSLTGPLCPATGPSILFCHGWGHLRHRYPQERREEKRPNEGYMFLEPQCIRPPRLRWLPVVQFSGETKNQRWQRLLPGCERDVVPVVPCVVAAIFSRKSSCGLETDSLSLLFNLQPSCWSWL